MQPAQVVEEVEDAPLTAAHNKPFEPDGNHDCQPGQSPLPVSYEAPKRTDLLDPLESEGNSDSTSHQPEKSISSEAPKQADLLDPLQSDGNGDLTSRQSEKSPSPISSEAPKQTDLLNPLESDGNSDLTSRLPEKSIPPEAPKNDLLDPLEPGANSSSTNRQPEKSASPISSEAPKQTDLLDPLESDGISDLTNRQPEKSPFPISFKAPKYDSSDLMESDRSSSFTSRQPKKSPSPISYEEPKKKNLLYPLESDTNNDLTSRQAEKSSSPISSEAPKKKGLLDRLEPGGNISLRSRQPTHISLPISSEAPKKKDLPDSFEYDGNSVPRRQPTRNQLPISFEAPRKDDSSGAHQRPSKKRGLFQPRKKHLSLWYGLIFGITVMLLTTVALQLHLSQQPLTETLHRSAVLVMDSPATNNAYHPKHPDPPNNLSAHKSNDTNTILNSSYSPSHLRYHDPPYNLTHKAKDSKPSNEEKRRPVLWSKQQRATIAQQRTRLKYNNSTHKAKDSKPSKEEKRRPVLRSKQQRATIAQQRTRLEYILAKHSDHMACEWPTECSSIMLNASSARISSGLNTSEYVIFQNNLPFDRFACGKVVLGEGGTVELNVDEVRNCQERTRVFWKMPSSAEDARAMPPTRIVHGATGTTNFEKSMKPFPNCSVPCHRSKGGGGVVSTLSVEGTNWEFAFSMEGPLYYTKLLLDSTSYQNDHYYAVTSFQSEIPLPYFSWTEYAIQNPPVDFDKAIKGASFLAKNCHSISNREQLVKSLDESILDVYSLSDCLHNAEPPAGVNMENKNAIMEQYLFHLAFENQVYDDYITEKMWGSLSSGTLPVYMGAPNIKDHVPPNSVVFADDFESPSDLAKFLVNLSSDKERYNSFHEWRQKPLNPEFVNKYNFTHVHSTCRACKWAYAKKYGLGWNHTEQEITTLSINRTTCRNKKGLITQPFEEYWMPDDAGRVGVAIHSPSDNRTCRLNKADRQIFIDDKSLSRTVYDADGVTDLIVVNKKQANYTLGLKFPIRANGLWPIDKHKSILQDDTSRITIVVKEEVQLRWSPRNATVAFKVAAATPSNPSTSLNIRIIVETIDHLHEGADKHVNYFGQITTQDFLNPMNTFIVYNFMSAEASNIVTDNENKDERKERRGAFPWIKAQEEKMTSEGKDSTTERENRREKRMKERQERQAKETKRRIENAHAELEKIQRRKGLPNWMNSLI